MPVELAERQEMGPSLSLLLSPDCNVLVPVAEARSIISSEQAEDAGSLVCWEMDFESTASERSLRDDKAYKELLEVVRLATGARDPQTLQA